MDEADSHWLSTLNSPAMTYRINLIATLMRNFNFNHVPDNLIKDQKAMKRQSQLIIIIIVLLTSLTGYGQNAGDSFTVDDIKYEITSLSSNPSLPHIFTGQVKVVDYEGTAKEVTIPTKVKDQGIYYRVTAIGNEAFSGHGKAEEDKLTSVDMPHTVTSIEESAFRNNNLTEVVIPLGVININDDFEDFIGASIGAFAFQDNPNLKTVIVRSNNPTSLHENAFGDRNQIDLLVPKDSEDAYKNDNRWKEFRSINPGTFVGDGITYAITSIAQGEVEIAGYDTIAASSGTEVKVTIPQTVTGTDYKVTAIGYKAFFVWYVSTRQKGPLTRVTFITPSNVTSIGENAFFNNQLTSIVIPESVTSLGQRAFGDNNQLTEVTIPNSVTSIPQWAFAQCNLKEVTIPANVEHIETQAFFSNPNLDLVTMKRDNPPTTLDADAFQGLQDTNLRHQIDLVVPTGSVQAYENAGWTDFESITEVAKTGGTFIADHITYQITSLTPPFEVTATGYNTAGGTIVNIPQTVDHGPRTYTVTSIGQQAFKDNQLTGVILPNTVTHIGGFAFANNQLNSVTLPGGVTRIDSVAFIDNPNLAMVMVERNDPPALHADAFQNPGRNQIDVIVPRGTPAGSIETDYEAAEWTGFASLEEGITLSIEGASEVESLSPFDMTFNFIRKVTGFTIDDISVNHATLSDFTGDGSSYTVKVTPTTCEGVIEITVPENVAEYTSNFPSLEASATIAVNATPSAPAVSSSPVEYCVDETATALTATGDNLLWYTSRTGGTGEATAPIPGTATAGSTTHYVSQTTNGCESERAEIVVIVKACPAQTGDVFTVSGMDYEITSVDPYTVTVIGINDTNTAGRPSETQTISVTIPETVTYKEITYTVTAVGANAFNDNPDLDRVTVEATHPPSLHENALTGRGQIDLIVPAGTREDYLKEGWTGFRSITLGIFTGKDIKYGITAVTPNEVMVLDYIGSATAVEIPGTVDDNGETYTVTAVGANAFSDNPDLATVKMEATHPLALHENAFADRSKINLIVPAGTREDYLNEGWTGFASITEEKVVTAIRNHEFNDFTLYPNPARDKVHIDIDPRSGQELKQVNIYTMNGACLHSENGPVINTGRLPRGTYLFEIVTKKGDRSMKKVIIQ